MTFIPVASCSTGREERDKREGFEGVDPTAEATWGGEVGEEGEVSWAGGRPWGRRSEGRYGGVEHSGLPFCIPRAENRWQFGLN